MMIGNCGSSEEVLALASIDTPLLAAGLFICINDQLKYEENKINIKTIHTNEAYEEKHFPMLPPDPIEALHYWLETRGLTRHDLEPCLGSRARVSEVLNLSRVGAKSVEAVDLTSFVITSVTLGSPPVAVGIVPQTAQVYVAQDHPLGRMTFVDQATFHKRTLTGFGLNGQIIE